MNHQELTLAISAITKPATRRQTIVEIILSLPMIQIFFAWFPSLALNFHRHHMLQCIEEFHAIMALSHHRTFKPYEKGMLTFVQGCIPDFSLHQLCELRNHISEPGQYINILAALFEQLQSELDRMKNVIKRSLVHSTQKQMLIQEIKHKKANIYSKLTILYGQSENVEGMLHAATKALEGYETLPMSEPYELYHYKDSPSRRQPILRDKATILRNQQYTIHYTLLFQSLQANDYRRAVLNLRELRKYQLYVSPSIDRFFPFALQALTEAGDYYTLHCLAKELAVHYSFKAKIPGLRLTENVSLIETKIQKYQSIAAQIEALIHDDLQRDIDTFVETKKPTLQVHLDRHLGLRISHETRPLELSHIRSLAPFGLDLQKVKRQNCWVLTNYMNIDRQHLLQFLTNLNQTLSEMQDTSYTFNMQSMRAALPSTKAPKKHKLKKHAEQTGGACQPPVEFEAVPNPIPLTSQRLGFKTDLGDTPIYPIHGAHVPKDYYYIYSDAFSRPMERSLEERYTELMKAGKVVGPHKTGIRFVGEKERHQRALPTNTIMKLAIKRENERVAIALQETATDANGDTHKLCRAYHVFKH